MRKALPALLVWVIACGTEPAPPVTADAAVPDVSSLPDVPPVAPDPGADAAPDVPDPPEVVEDVCDCSDAPPPVCPPGRTTCQGLDTVRRCADDGSGHTQEACAADTVCYLGQCTPLICDPQDPPFCVDGQRLACNSLGTDLVPLPCAGGQGCQEGLCVPVRPNVILIVDTSGSMSLISGPGEVYPEVCEGEGCPPWSWPLCDDPAAPLTRLGRTKKALEQLILSEPAASVRLALQRFAQTGHSVPNCKQGHYHYKGLVTGDEDYHAVNLAWFEPHLHEIMAVPFDPASPDSDVTALLRWIDFTEAVAPPPNATECIHPFNCDSRICVDGLCQEHVDPELRGIGATPLGRSLFYAGEYLRHFVLIEGKPCQSDTDCPSPDHTCQDGECHDPLHHCRQTSVILFTDGEETVNDGPNDFFNPMVQAKRLRWGLGCTAGVQCAHGATCEEGLCTPPPGAEPLPMCKGTTLSCAEVSTCPDYFCGSETPCPGECQSFPQPFKDPQGKNYLQGYDQRPRSVTVHVVDASGYTLTNQLIAAWGGGVHVPVDFEDTDTIAEQLLNLLDPKEAPSCTP